MSRRKIEVNLLVCERCGYEWIAREIPKRCSKCKSKYWDSPREGEPAKPKRKPRETAKPRQPVGLPPAPAVPISRECAHYAHGGCKTAGCPCTCHEPHKP